jgi:TatA/E family protein of Tat protein translocase
MMLEILIIILLATLLFGYRKLPAIGRALGRAPGAFTDGRQEDH